MRGQSTERGDLGPEHTSMKWQTNELMPEWERGRECGESQRVAVCEMDLSSLKCSALDSAITASCSTGQINNESKPGWWYQNSCMRKMHCGA